MPLSQIADFTPPAAPRRVSKPSLQNQRIAHRTMHHPAAGESRSRRTLSAVTKETPGRRVGAAAAAAAPVGSGGGGGGKRGDRTPMAQGQGEEVTPGVTTRASPQRAAKDRANRLLQQHVPIPVAEVVLEHDAASAAAAGGTHSPSISVRSNDSSDSNYNFDAASGAGDRVTAARDDLVDVLFSPEDEDVDVDYEVPTDAEVSKYTFFQRLLHYMEGEPIRHSNRKAVEMALLVEAGTMVRNMDTMKKSDRENVLLRKYIALIDEIEDECFESPSVRDVMKKRYRGAKKDLTGESLLRKLDAEMRELRKFASKFPGFSNPSSLPSGTTQLSQMKIPAIVDIWKKTYPNVPGVDYRDNDSIMSHVQPSWWLEHDSCKFMLAIFVHKDNKDLSSQPTTLLPGDTRENARKNRHSAIQEERAIARVARPVDLSVSVERYGDVDHQMKKVRVDGMRFQADAIATNTIVTQIKVLRKNADVYKAMMGEAKYNDQLVALINKMPGMTPNTPTTTTVDVPNDENEEEGENSD
jgi:hypothetical protein